MLLAVGQELWKVTRNGPGGANAASVLATQEPASYDEAIKRGLPVTGKLDGSPVFAFWTEADALAFCKGHYDRSVRKVKATGELVLPKKVLSLKMGWKAVAARFYADARAGNTDIGYWPTEDASKGTVMVFGYVTFVK